MTTWLNISFLSSVHGTWLLKVNRVDPPLSTFIAKDKIHLKWLVPKVEGVHSLFYLYSTHRNCFLTFGSGVPGLNTGTILCHTAC